MALQNEIKNQLKSFGAKIIRFVDISALPESQNKNYPNAILFGMPLSPQYLHKITQTPGYIKKLIRNNQIETDEFHLTELKTDHIADKLARLIRLEGFEAYSQSEKNIDESGF